jgi:signal transduction histidine kinase
VWKKRRREVQPVKRSSLRLLEGQAKKKGVRLLFSPSAFVPTVLADERQVKQVFMNLGNIDVESVVGEGTSFYVYLPHAQA